jgi:manganese transport protein
VTLGLWAQAEVMAMATDLAVFVGGAVALNLLFGIALFPVGVITAIATLTMTGNRKRYEAVIAGMLAAILLAFLYETIVAGGDLGALGAGLLPSFPSSESVLLAAGILGTTVMPHTIYLHSAMTLDQATSDRTKLRRAWSASGAPTCCCDVGGRAGQRADAGRRGRPLLRRRADTRHYARRCPSCLPRDYR